MLEPPTPTEIYIDPNAFTKMRKLRLLILHNVHNSYQGPMYLPNELRWFRWAGCARPIPQFSSGRKKLVGLDMSKCNMTVVPKQFKDFQQLKYLNFSECQSLVQMPDLSCTPNLEELDLQNCKNLVEAHDSIAYHDKLHVLNLSGCSELCVFPNVLKSKNLGVLDLDECTKLEKFPDVPHKLEGLKELGLEGTAIKELPASIENLVTLERLYLRNCKNLVNLPSSIYKLQKIETLVLDGCTNLIEFPKYKDLADPHMEFGLPSLRWLNLRGCNLPEMEFLDDLSCFPSLTTLFLWENNITSLPTSINKRHQLKQLEVSNCRELQEIPELPPFLGILRAEGCESLQKKGDFTSIHNLVRRTSTMPLGQNRPTSAILLPGGEMPEWVLPVEDGSISFMASANLYDKFIGFVLCVVLGNNEQKGEHSFVVGLHANDKSWVYNKKTFDALDSDHIWLHYRMSDWLRGEVDFGQNGESHVQFLLTISSTNVKKWGFRITCKPLEDDLRAVLQDNRLMDPALLYEIGHESTDLEAESSLMHEDCSIKTDLQKGLQDCQLSADKHSQILSKRNHKLIHPQGMPTKKMLTSNSTVRDEHGSVGLQLLLLE